MRKKAIQMLFGYRVWKIRYGIIPCGGAMTGGIGMMKNPGSTSDAAVQCAIVRMIKARLTACYNKNFLRVPAVKNTPYLDPVDSLTHIALGGLAGEVLLGKRLGKTAVILGAAAQSIPDIDFIASFWLDVPADLLAHRGFTHSFLFVALLAPLLSWGAIRRIDSAIPFRSWMLFFAVQLMLHLLLDSLNAYGTGWLEPFSHHRFSFHTLFVADPLYTVPLLVAFVALLIMHRGHKFRTRTAVAVLIISTGYLVYALTNKLTIDRAMTNALQKQGIPHQRYFTTPTPLNTWLWMVVAEQPDGFQIGHRSVFDREDTIAFTHFARRDSLLIPYRTQNNTQRLLRFSQGYYTVEQRSDTVVFNDLRFGQQQGWLHPKGRFVFQYYLTAPDANQLVVQRGRFAGWDMEHIRAMYLRICGN